MMLLAYVLPFCLLGQVLSKHLLVETENEDGMESFETNENEVEHTMVSTNKKEEAAENLIFDMVDEENAAIFENLPKKKKKGILKKVGKLMEKEEKQGGGNDYFWKSLWNLVKEAPKRVVKGVKAIG